MHRNCFKSRRIHKIYLQLLICLVIVGSLSALPMGRADKNDGILYYGVGSLLVDLDPQNAWDSASIDVIDQVCEGLLGYNLSDPDLAIVPVLAASIGTWNTEATFYTLTLKEGITFHDGSTLNASDVKWTFDRLNNLIDRRETQIAELYTPIGGEIVINETIVVDPQTFSFHLNYPYAPFEALLCYSGSYILSDESTPFNKTLDSETDILVGTGPYKYIRQTAAFTDTVAYASWWGERSVGSIKEILWMHYSNNTFKQQAFLAGELDWIDGYTTEFLDQYIESPNIHVDPLRRNTGIIYLGINNEDVPREMRQAISWAVDYNSIIEEICAFNAARLTSPVPEGIKFHNPHLAYPVYNVTHSRQILIDAGQVPAAAGEYLNDDAYWTALAVSGSPIANYTYTWIENRPSHEAIGWQIKSDLEQIGIFVSVNCLTYADILLRNLTMDQDPMEIFQQFHLEGWGPDYNDPSCYVNPLFSNASSSNRCKVNDAHLQALITAGLVESDTVTRRDLYYEMQEYIVDELVPCVFLYVGCSHGCWSTELDGIQPNPMGKIDFASMNWQTINGTNTTTDNTGGDGQSSAGDQFVGWGAGMLAIFGFCAIWALVKKHQRGAPQL